MVVIHHDQEGLVRDERTAKLTADFAEDEFCTVMEDYREAWENYIKDQNENTLMELFRSTTALSMMTQAISAVAASQARKIAESVKDSGDPMLALQLHKTAYAVRDATVKKARDGLSEESGSGNVGLN